MNVYNAQNEKIGDIKELMLDKNGKINIVAIGVGGFLGMGERDVAVKFDRLKWSNEPVKSTSSGATTTTGSAQSQANRDRNYPDHAVLDATKDQLKAMPQFGAENCLSSLSKWGRKRGYTEVNFTFGIDLPKAGKGHLPWTEEQLAAAASKFTGVMRRGFLLYQHTGLRGSDVVRLGPTDVDTYQGRDAFALTTQKRKRDVWCPIMPTLAAEMATSGAPTGSIPVAAERQAVHAQGIRQAVCRGTRCDPRTERPDAARVARDGGDQPAPRWSVVCADRRHRRHEREDGRALLPQCRHALEQPRRANWPQQLRLEEPAPEGCQDDRREPDHGGIDQQARTADHLGLEKPVAEEKQDNHIRAMFTNG